MKKMTITFILFLMPCMLVAQAGTTGLALLKVGMGGQGAALGEAVVATENGAMAAYWNPAGLSHAENELVLGHSEWIQDVSYEFIAAKFHGYNASWGLLLQVQNVDNIMHRTSATPEPLATFSEHEIVAGISYARPVGQNLAAGATVKFISERHFSYTSKGAAVDFGVQYKLSQIQGLQLAASLHNLGKLTELRSESTRLPALLRMGAAWAPRNKILQADLRLLAGFTKIFDNQSYSGFGIEGMFKKTLALRLGYQAGREAQSLTAGLGVQFKHYSIDYAYVPFSFDLGDTHRISFSLKI